MFCEEDFTSAEDLGDKHFLYPLANCLCDFSRVSILHDPEIDGDGNHTLGVTALCEHGMFDEIRFSHISRILATATELYNAEAKPKSKKDYPYVEVHIGVLGPSIGDPMVVEVCVTESCGLETFCEAIDLVTHAFFDQAREIDALNADPQSRAVN